MTRESRFENRSRLKDGNHGNRVHSGSTLQRMGEGSEGRMDSRWPCRFNGEERDGEGTREEVEVTVLFSTVRSRARWQSAHCGSVS